MYMYFHSYGCSGGILLHTVHMHDLKFTLIASNAYLDAISLQFQSMQQNHKQMNI